MIPLPLALKRLVPGYARRWRMRYAGFMAEVARAAPGLRYGESECTPWIERTEDGLRLHGFWTERENADAYDMLRPDLPRDLPRTHFRLVKDYVNRFLFPHMRPDLKPAGFGVEQLWGFHGQHKDAIPDIPDATARASPAPSRRSPARSSSIAAPSLASATSAWRATRPAAGSWRWRPIAPATLCWRATLPIMGSPA